MTMLNIVIAFLVPVITGYSLLLYLFKKNEMFFFERLAVSFVLGSGLLTIIMTIFVLFKIPLEFYSIILIPILFIAYTVYKFRKEILTPIKIPKIEVGSGYKKALFIIILMLVCFQVIFVFSEALLYPTYTWDALANWIYRAKIIFYERLPRHIYITDYPLHVSLFASWFSIVLGEWSETYKIISPLYYVSMLFSFYLILRRYKDHLHSIFFTFLLSALPLLSYHATISYADLTAAVFYFFATAYLYLFFESKQKGFLAVSALFAGMTALVKSEGIFYFIVLIAVLAVYLLRKKLKYKALINYIGAGFLAILPWTILYSYLKIYSHLGFHNKLFPDQPYTIEILWQRLLLILQSFYNKFLFEGNWHLLWFCFIIVVIIFYEKILSNNLKYIYFLIALNLFILIIIFGATEMFLCLPDPSVTFNRIVLHFIPIVMLGVGLAVGIEKELNL